MISAAVTAAVIAGAHAALVGTEERRKFIEQYNNASPGEKIVLEEQWRSRSRQSYQSSQCEDDSGSGIMPFFIGMAIGKNL